MRDQNFDLRLLLSSTSLDGLLRFSIDPQTVIRLIRGQRLATLTGMQCCEGLGVAADPQPEHVPLNLPSAQASSLG